MSMSIGGSAYDLSQLSSNLFSKLDTSQQGYIDKSQLQSAFDALSSSDDATSTATVDEVFTQLDSNGDGKITEGELSDNLQTLADTLLAQLHQSRMQGMDAAPPPPPGEDSEEGYTQEELTSMASEISSTDSKRAGLMSALATNFEAADTDGNGKISREEAMSFDQSDGTVTTADSDTSAKVMLQMLQLLQSYGVADNAEAGASTVSVSA